MLEFDILRKDTPAVYDLDLVEGNKGLIIKTHPQATGYLESMLGRTDVPMTIALEKELSLTKFIPFGSKRWGFGPILRHTGEDNGWMKWQCNFPKGKRPGIDWQALFEVSATLNVFFKCLGWQEKTIDSPYQQLLHPSLVTDRGMHGGSLVANLGKTLLPWISSHPDNSRRTDVEKAMRDVYMYTSGTRIKEDEQYLYRVMAWFRQPCWVNLSCPGNACGLDPDNYDYDPRRGYILYPHNVDSPIQQLTLLSGLAAINMAARADGY